MCQSFSALGHNMSAAPAGSESVSHSADRLIAEQTHNRVLYGARTGHYYQLTKQTYFQVHFFLFLFNLDRYWGAGQSVLLYPTVIHDWYPPKIYGADTMAAQVGN